VETLEVQNFTTKTIDRLRSQFQKLDDVTLYSEQPTFAAQVSCYGILREVGGPNDELARFIFDADSKNVVERSSLQAEIVTWKTLTGVRIWSNQSSRIEIRTPGFKDLLHPLFSYNDDGTIRCLVIFPEIISKIIKAKGVDAVIVKRWGLNTIFGGFDSSRGYYQTNFWELENNDSLLFADLTRQGRVAFLGTHDLIAHICGIDANAWTLLRRQAEDVYQAIKKYFESVQKPSITAMILPYTIGVILDDLAQPPTYGSKSHALFLEALLSSLQQKVVAPDLKTVLGEFPVSFEKIIMGSRSEDYAKDSLLVSRVIEDMVSEINRHSIVA
jgi:hypothetical protein